MEEIKLLQEDNSDHYYEFDNIPDTCPYCGFGIVPTPIIGCFQNLTKPGLNRNDTQVVFQCPRASCKALFVTQYSHSYGSEDDHFFIQRDLFKDSKKIRFSNAIENISPDFVKIYNQAYQAEQFGLSLISGPGYRKSLEFLIKDYAIKISDESEGETIKERFLGKVIEQFIDDNRIKSVAKRAAWLGNDETHYVREWLDKDIKELKILIDLTVRWIEMVELTKAYESDMPDK